jgi:hypothetical protein
MPVHVQPYAPELLPKGFTYPDSYLEFVDQRAVPDRLIWWFPDERFGHAKRAWEFRLHWQSKGWLYLNEIDPIPFARNGDWAAFFDGNDHSGDPRVVVVDLGNKMNSYKLQNFDAWYQMALKESGLN